MFVSTQIANKAQVLIFRCFYYHVHIICSQLLAAAAIGVPAHKVLTRVKRVGMETTYLVIAIEYFCLGGAFGGKGTHSVMLSASVAVAANK